MKRKKVVRSSSKKRVIKKPEKKEDPSVDDIKPPIVPMQQDWIKIRIEILEQESVEIREQIANIKAE